MLTHGDLEQGKENILRTSIGIGENGYKICATAMVTHIFLQLVVNLDGQQCNKFAPTLIRDFYLCAGFAFSITAIQQIAQAVYSTSNRKKFMLHTAAVTISLIAGSSSFLTYVYHYGTCQNGMESKATQLSQWMICAPLLAYMVIAGEDKESLSFLDIGVIISLLVVMFCMLLISFTFTNQDVDKIFFIFGFLTAILSMTLALIKIYGLRECNGKYLLSEKSASFFFFAMNNSLLKLTCGILPSLPILYLIYYYQIIDSDQFQLGYVVLSVFANSIFLNFIVHEQIHVAEKTRFRKEAEMLANTARRTFLR